MSPHTTEPNLHHHIKGDREKMKAAHAPRRTVLRATAASLAASVALLGFTACTGGGGGGSLSGKGDAVTLTVPTSQAPWNPAYDKLIQEYQKETGNRINLRPFPNPDVKTQEVNDVQSQSHTFDVYQINEQDLVQFNENGWIQPFTDVDPSYKPDDSIYSYSNVGRWNADKKIFDSSGELTNLPILGNVDIFVYRTDVYKKLGLEVPTTWDQMIANGKKIQESGDLKYGGVYRTQGVPGTYSTTFEFQSLLNGAGGAWFKDPGTDWTPTADSSEAVLAATRFRELAKQGPAATTTIGQAQAIAAMQAGDAGQTYMVAAAAAQLESESDSSVAGKVGFAPLPPTPAGTSSSATGLWSLAIPSGLPKARAKAALEFITWITSAKAQTLFAQAGGIPVREEAYSASDLPKGSEQALAAVKETAAGLPDDPTSLRFSFSTQMLNFTEPDLQQIAAGKVSPEEGMKKIQQQLEALIQKEGLATS